MAGKNTKTIDTRFLTSVINSIIVGNSKARSRFVKYYYFLWRNKIDTTQTKFSEMTEEEFLKRYNLTEKRYNTLKGWETTKEYKRIKLLLLDAQMIDDILKIYDVMREKALNGDDKAVKTLLVLQEQIQKLNKDLNFSKVMVQQEQTQEQEDDDDDLILE